ncbi:MAG: hypothetical protein IPM64_12360 [Phycisphaerales bacterium]|nr:hypothetical protein [Phycisphaerales bacterium]
MRCSRACGPLGLLIGWLAVTAAIGQESATTRAASQPESQRAATSQPATKPARPAPEIGDTAPPFKLKSLDGKSEFELTSLRGKRPVLLLFGSYT